MKTLKNRKGGYWNVFFCLEENNMKDNGLTFIKELYYNFSDEERKKYALVEMNIKNFQYYNAKHGDSVLKKCL